jgi:regulator of protease activity HflC (stomatin/prohibitin superfamily)
VCAIVQRYPDAAVALAEAAGVRLPEHDEVVAALRPDMFERLRELESFREYEAKVRAEAEAEAEVAVAEAKAEAAKVRAEAAKVRAEAAKVRAEAVNVRAEAEVATTASNLKEYVVLRGDAPSEYALNTISACRNADVLAAWLKRAYLGETSAQLFPEPKLPTS